MRWGLCWQLLRKPLSIKKNPWGQQAFLTICGGILLIWSTTEICGTFSIGEWMDSWMGSSSRIGSNILQVFMDYCSASKGIPIHVVLYKLPVTRWLAAQSKTYNTSSQTWLSWCSHGALQVFEVLPLYLSVTDLAGKLGLGGGTHFQFVV